MLLLHNANIFSSENPGATALALDQGLFLAIGSDAEILGAFEDADTIINLDGKTLWPGLTDAHVHLRHWAESIASVDCETDTLDECLARVEKKAKQLPPGAWLRGHGWNHTRWAEGFGSKTQLDAVCGDHPAYLTAKSLHAAWVSSRAMKIAGIAAQTPDSPGGRIQKDSMGQLTGILFEADAMAIVESIIPKPTIEELTQIFKVMIPELWKLGLVGVHDYDGYDCWQALQTMHKNGSLNLRVRKNVPFDHMDAFIDTGLRTDDGDDWLHLGGVKLFSDGALGPQTGAMLKPYQGSENLGFLLLTEDEIVDIGKKAVNNGLALSIHAIGDLANRVVLNAFEKLRVYEQEHHLPHFRHRIEHVQVIDPADLPRLAALDIIASVQPSHAPSDMIIADRYLGTRSTYAYAYHALMESGATLVFGSDAPVESVNPFYGIHAAVTRRRLDGMPGADGWHPKQRLSLEESLCGFSQTPAEIANRGDRLGKIDRDYRADFIILEENPFSIHPQDLSRIKPLATFINGNCVYASPDSGFDFPSYPSSGK